MCCCTAVFLIAPAPGIDGRSIQVSNNKTLLIINPKRHWFKPILSKALIFIAFTIAICRIKCLRTKPPFRFKLTLIITNIRKTNFHKAPILAITLSGLAGFRRIEHLAFLHWHSTTTEPREYAAR